MNTGYLDFCVDHLTTLINVTSGQVRAMYTCKELNLNVATCVIFESVFSARAAHRYPTYPCPYLVFYKHHLM